MTRLLLERGSDLLGSFGEVGGDGDVGLDCERVARNQQ
jgi:hypothetical protein